MKKIPWEEQRKCKMCKGAEEKMQDKVGQEEICDSSEDWAWNPPRTEVTYLLKAKGGH